MKYDVLIYFTQGEKGDKGLTPSRTVYRNVYVDIHATYITIMAGVDFKPGAQIIHPYTGIHRILVEPRSDA